MAQNHILTSPNITLLDIKVVADICQGKFFIDLSPSLFIGTGAQLVQGAKIQITNPFDVLVKEYGVPFDISKTGSPSSITNTIYQFPIPKVNTLYQYGLYVIKVELTDSAGTKYEVIHNLSICEPDSKDKTKKYGTIKAQIIGNCLNGKLIVLIDEPPVYKGFGFESKTQTSTLTYPTGGPTAPFVTTASAFSLALYEGVHLLKSEVCVTYNLTENNYVKVPYKVDCKKNILCRVDLCCVYNKMSEINLQLDSDCSVSQREKLIDVTLDSIRLLKIIDLGSSCGEDISEYIEQLEVLLNCKCSCSAAEGTPVVNNTTTYRDFSITGCNVVKTVNGLTDSYQIENYAYEVTTDPAASFITIGAPTLTDCTKKQQLTFNVAGLYTAVKGLIANQTEYNYWSNIVKSGLIPTVGNLACLGITMQQYLALSYSDFWNLVISKICAISSGSSCVAVISGLTAVAQGQNTLISWTNNSSVFKVEVYIDNVLQQVVISPLTTFLATGFNDNAKHSYKLVSYCSNGAPGNILSSQFTFQGCPSIPAPSLSSNNVQNATCPFNLNSLVTPVAGLSIEWHNANTNQSNDPASTLVPNPAAVTSGTYYAYQVDVNKCYSPASTVVVACVVAGNCTEPLNLLVEKSSFNNFLITFNAAATPPPSYLVKRKLASSPDVDASYTVIGTPVFNSSLNLYQITDNNNNSFSSSTLYTYKAESQCADGTRPSAYFNYAFISCPLLSLVSTDVSVNYEFLSSNGVTKYVVKILDENNQEVNSALFTSPYASPITGVFNGLTPNKLYKVFITAFVGTAYSKECNKQNIPTQMQTGGSTYYFGYTQLDTVTETPTEAEYLAAVDAAYLAATTASATFNPGTTKITVADFLTGGQDKVMFMEIPSAEAPFTLWSSEQFQLFQPIDASFEGGGLFFKSTRGSNTIYITRYQTTFPAEVVFSR